VWQLLGVEQLQNGGRCHGNQGVKNANRTADPFIQNGRHSKPKWSPYGAVCLTPCKYSFPLKSFHF
jgi:hypothetical protein